MGNESVRRHHQERMNTGALIVIFLSVTAISLTKGQTGKDEKTFGWVGDILFGNCQESRCRQDFSRAEYCCRNERRCCSYSGGNWGNGWNNGGGWNNGVGERPSDGGNNILQQQQTRKMSFLQWKKKKRCGARIWKIKWKK